MFEHFPYTNMHELNLDWIIEQVKKAYSPDNPPDNLVLSVNGQTGEVVLYQDANVQLPSVESNQWNIYRLVTSQNGQTARGIEFSGNGTARIINGTHRALIYTSENPPAYPVDSVNGQTGAVTIQVPFVNTTDELMQFATDSEDNYWGLRRNTTGGEAGIYLDTAGETVRAYITLMPEYEGEGTPQTFQLLTTNDIPESSGVVSVNGLTGVVRLFGTNIYRTDNSNQTLNQAISTLENTTNTLNTRTGKLEGTANALEDGIAIVANGNTHPSIASGQFVYIKNHPSLTEGLYTANSAIGTNAELTTSNVTADGSGGLNALKAKIGNVGNTDLQSQVTSLNSKIGRIISSGSLHDITVPGIYWLTSSVTDKPETGAGTYIIGAYSSAYLSGVFISADNDHFYTVKYSGGNWEYEYLTYKKTYTVTATTSETGAIPIENAYRVYTFVGGHLTTGGPGFVIRRDESYFTVFSNSGAPMANTAVAFEAVFIS